MRFFNINKVLQNGRRLLANLTEVSESVAGDPKRLAETLKGIQDRLIALEGKAVPEATEFEVDVGELGSIVKLNHGFNCPVRWFVTSWKGRSDRPLLTAYTPERCLWSVRAATDDQVQNVAANAAEGVVYRMKVRRIILGIRFAYQNNSTTSYSYKCVLWNNTTGGIIAQKTVTGVMRRGIYEAFFDAPVVDDLTGTDITFSIYETTGARAILTTFNTTNNVETPDFIIVNQGTSVIGDARPTSDNNVDNAIEPILGEYVAAPSLVLDSSSTQTILSLRSYVAGRAIIRIEPSQYTVS